MGLFYMLDGVPTSVAFKGVCRVATTANIALSGIQSIDGVTVSAYDRVLVKNQSAGADNGIWLAASGAWRRAADWDTTRDVVQGTAAYVTQGSTNTGIWVVTTVGTITIGTTAVTFEGGLFIKSEDDSDDITEGAANLFLTVAERAKIGGDYVTPSMYGGVIGDEDFDSAAAIEAAFAANSNVLFDGIYYVGNTGVTIDAAGCLYAINPNCGIAAMDGAAGGNNGLINITASAVKVLGLNLDGSDLFRYGINDTAGDSTIQWNFIKNIYSATSTAVGVFSTSTVGSRITDNIFREIESVGNASPGDADGPSRAILVQTTADITVPYYIERNDISRVIGEEGDAIQILCFSNPTFYSAGDSVVSGNRIRRCSKRGIKIQAHKVTVQNNNIVMLADLGADLYAGIDTIDSEDVTVDGNFVVVTSTMRAISISSTGTSSSKRNKVTNNRIKTDTTTLAFGIVANGFEDITIEGNHIEYGYIALTGDGIRGSVSNNVGINSLATSEQAFVQGASTVTYITYDSNRVLSGAIYAVVHVIGPNNFVTNNKRVSGDYRCVYVNGAGCIDNIITGNLSFSTTYAAVIFNSATEAGQTHVFDNRNATQLFPAARQLCAEIGAPHLLGSSAVKVSHTGTTAETILATVTVPAGAMGLNGFLAITSHASCTNSANNKTFRWRLGGIGGAIVRTITLTATLNSRESFTVHNRNSATSQLAGPPSGSLAGGFGNTTGTWATTTADTSAAQTLVLTGELANTGEEVAVEAYSVFVNYVA